MMSEGVSRSVLLLIYKALRHGEHDEHDEHDDLASFSYRARKNIERSL